MKRFILACMVFLFLMFLWYLYDKGGVSVALFPISVPVGLFFVLGIEARWLIALPLFLYAVFLILLFTWLEKRPGGRRLIIGAVGLLVVMHLVTFRFIERALSEMGERIVEQMLWYKK